MSFYGKKHSGDCSCGHGRSGEIRKFGSSDDVEKKAKRLKPINRDTPKLRKATMKCQKAISKSYERLVKKAIAAYSSVSKADQNEADKIMSMLEQDFDDESSSILDAVTEMVRAGVKDSVDKTVNQLESYAGDQFSESFSSRMTEKAQEKALSSAGDRIDESGDFTRERFRSELADALENGLTTDEFAANLSDSYAFSMDRSRTIARTEMASAHVAATVDVYQQVGVQKKCWLLGQDDYCDICEANAQAGYIAMDESFPDGSDAPPGHPNCRCDLGAEMEGWDLSQADQGDSEDE